MSVELWSAILAAAALMVALVAAYFAKHSASAAERSAAAAERSADAARDQADETRRGNELVQQARQRGVRATDATTSSASTVGWEVERGSRPDVVRLRNVGEAAAANVSVGPAASIYTLSDTAAVQPHEAVDVGLLSTAEMSPATYLLVSWDGVVTPVSVPIPPE
ncbi:hypothetical protein ACFPJ1_37050 [Kribbella qitaiheensis]|uniref:hypothetical protein n=1 Tax=Kribbella qitaiheensis TaxID=1544730 RepID=UPI0036064C74